jgi:hypothetical protein
MPKQHLLNIIIYMKHDEITSCMMPSCGISQKQNCDDVVFIASKHEPHIYKWNSMVHIERWGYLKYICKKLPRCIRFIDGTLIKIHNPYWNEAYHTWFKGWKKIYAMNNIIILNHRGSFIYIDIGYPNSYYDVSILWHSNVYKDWH